MEIRDWLRQAVQRELDVGTTLEDDRPLADYGVESVTVIGLTGDLEDWLGLELDPTMFFDHPTLDALAAYLAGESAKE